MQYFNVENNQPLDNFLIMIFSRKLIQRFSLQSGRLFIWKQDSTPKHIPLNQEVLRVALGPNHTVIVTDSGKAYSYGDNVNGQCGHGHKFKVETPQLIQYFESHNIKVKDAVCGQKYTLVLDQNNQVYSFGYGGQNRGMLLNLFFNPYCPLGHGNHLTYLKPAKIKAFEGKKIERITSGRQFSTAIDSSGSIYNWGNGQYGAYGDGKNKSYILPTQNEYFKYLQQQQQLTVKKIKSCQSYSIALLSDGKLYGWGSNESGQMGVKSQIGIEIYQTVNFPTQVIRQGYEKQKVVNFDISENILLFELDNGEFWWTGMKKVYMPQKLKIQVQKMKLFAAGSRCIALVDDQNNIFTSLNYVKGKFENSASAGIKKIKGQELFGGTVVGIGGEYDSRYAIVK